jgi:hypothetical protein
MNNVNEESRDLPIIPFELTCDLTNDLDFVGVTLNESSSGYTGICRIKQNK